MKLNSGSLRYFCCIKNGTTPASARSDYWDDNIKWVTPEDLGRLMSNKIINTKRLITEKAVEECNLPILPEGSVIISTRAPIGHMAINESPMSFNQGCRGIIPGHQVHGPFLYYMLKSRVCELNAMANGTTFVELSRDELAAVSVEFPPLDTQRRIAQFLDEKTARIDTLIEKKRELLDRLAEKRQALITRAVTKGLSPDVPMKSSGIDWLGDIPAHWDVKRLRFLLNGGTLNGLYKAKEAFVPEGIPFVQMGEAFRSSVFDGGTEDCVNSSKNEIDKWGLLNGDFLIARRSIVFEGSGKFVLVSGLERPHLFESSMIRIRLQNPKYYSGYLFFYFQSHIGRESILSMTKRVTISGIDSQQLKSIHVPIPSNFEARDIATACEMHDQNIQHVERKISASIERLVEYHSALVTSAVTGQISEL